MVRGAGDCRDVRHIILRRVFLVDLIVHRRGRRDLLQVLIERFARLVAQVVALIDREQAALHEARPRRGKRLRADGIAVVLTERRHATLNDGVFAKAKDAAKQEHVIDLHVEMLRGEGQEIQNVIVLGLDGEQRLDQGHELPSVIRVTRHKARRFVKVDGVGTHALGETLLTVDAVLDQGRLTGIPRRGDKRMVLDNPQRRGRAVFGRHLSVDSRDAFLAARYLCSREMEDKVPKQGVIEKVQNRKRGVFECLDIGNGNARPPAPQVGVHRFTDLHKLVPYRSGLRLAHSA